MNSRQSHCGQWGGGNSERGIGHGPSRRVVQRATKPFGIQMGRRCVCGRDDGRRTVAWVDIRSERR